MTATTEMVVSPPKKKKRLAMQPMTFKFSTKAIADMFKPLETQLCFCARCEKKRELKGYILRRPHCASCYEKAQKSILTAIANKQYGGDRMHNYRKEKANEDA